MSSSTVTYSVQVTQTIDPVVVVRGWDLQRALPDEDGYDLAGFGAWCRARLAGCQEAQHEAFAAALRGVGYDVDVDFESDDLLVDGFVDDCVEAVTARVNAGPTLLRVTTESGATYTVDHGSMTIVREGVSRVQNFDGSTSYLDSETFLERSAAVVGKPMWFSLLGRPNLTTTNVVHVEVLPWGPVTR